jgi:hypothetical protein
MDPSPPASSSSSYSFEPVICAECEACTAFCICSCEDAFCSACWRRLHRGAKLNHLSNFIEQPLGLPVDLPWPDADWIAYLASAAAHAGAGAGAGGGGGGGAGAGGWNVAGGASAAWQGADASASASASYAEAAPTMGADASTSAPHVPIELPDNAIAGIVQGRRSSVVGKGGRRNSLSSWQEQAHKEEETVDSLKISAVGGYVRRASITGQLPASMAAKARVINDAEAIAHAAKFGEQTAVARVVATQFGGSEGTADGDMAISRAFAEASKRRG